MKLRKLLKKIIDNKLNKKKCWTTAWRCWTYSRAL